MGIYHQEQEAEELAPDVETVAAQFERYGILEEIPTGAHDRAASPGASKGLPRHGEIAQPFAGHSQVPVYSATGRSISPGDPQASARMRPDAPSFDNPEPPEIEAQKLLPTISLHDEDSKIPAPAILGLALESAKKNTDFNGQDELEEFPKHLPQSIKSVENSQLSAMPPLIELESLSEPLPPMPPRSEPESLPEPLTPMPPRIKPESLPEPLTPS